jgi:hypothetical protein
VWVRPDLPARVALYLRPASMDPRLEGGSNSTAPPPRPAPAPAVETVSASALWSSSAWLPATA